jgi:hypothetical protein
MMRMMAALTGVATAAAGSLTAADRAGGQGHDALGMLGMGGGDAGMWLLVLGLVVVIVVAVTGNDNDGPKSP